MKNYKLTFIVSGFVLLFSAGCTKDLDTDPLVELTLDQLLQQDPQAIDGLMSKVYGSFALSGPQGPGSSDISDDAGESPFLRGIINLEDFTADDMKNRWGDNGLDQLTTTQNWNPNNKFFRYLYNRVYYTIPQCNNIINVLNRVNPPNSEQYIAELRFLRCLAYYYMIDCFGKGVIATETDINSGVALPQSSRQEMYTYVESELLAIENTLPSVISYGRTNKNVVRMLLAKLYLNAEVYTGTPRYDKALEYSAKVINEGGYQLAPDFVSLFSADNNMTAAKNEIIYPLIADATVSQSFGNTTYLVNGSLSTETMNISDYGALQGWTGHRATKAWYGLYGNLSTSPDVRASLFFRDGHNFEMNDYKTWIDGYPSTKFRNTNFVGGSVATDFSGTDFPLFRLADAYLIYAECQLRGGGGSAGTALQYVNDVRARSNSTPIAATDFNLDYILDERARELNFEGHRRSDLIRFGKFSGGSYLWPWKGGVKNGSAIPESYKLFPIPLSAIQANPNLTQNPGY